MEDVRPTGAGVPPPRDEDWQSTLVTGLLLVGVGVVLLGGQLGWGPAWSFDRVWPAGLIIWGGARMITAALHGRWCSSGFWIMLVGIVVLLDQYRILRFHQSWPIWVIGLGVSLLVGRSPVFVARVGVHRRRRRRDEADSFDSGVLR